MLKLIMFVEKTKHIYSRVEIKTLKICLLSSPLLSARELGSSQFGPFLPHPSPLLFAHGSGSS
jgi:hypothetical protein